MLRSTSYIVVTSTIAVVIAFLLFTQVDNLSKQRVNGAQQDKKVGRVASSSNGAMPQEKSTEQAIKHIRITAQDIARLFRGRSYLVDLTRRGTIYHFNPTSRPIDYSRIKVRTATGELNMAAWLKKHLLSTVGSRWRFRRLRVGVAKELGRLKLYQPGSSEIQAYTNEGGVCHCSGDDDCNNMFSDDACIDEGVCIEDDPLHPECFCLCASSSVRFSTTEVGLLLANSSD